MAELIYYFKKNHKVYKNKISYLKMIQMLEMDKLKDKKGQSYTKGHTYQLQWMQDFMLNNKDLGVFKCNVFVDGQLIF
tara:strand:+ start:411 stop:644 length:234 start_codon:yes stop_codon:yes gene_type:complete